MENKEFTSGLEGAGADWVQESGGSSYSKESDYNVASGGVGAQAGKIGEQVSAKMDDVKVQVRERASKVKDQTTRGIDRVTTYFREHDKQEIMQDLEQVIRKHPGKSVIAGMFLGLMVGRIIK